ncbi:hypothetical protein HMI54_004697 [Coelomomyces lativittatus]|nr:hypothetical protein HMI55_007334 [Coelomomyces lativittatus]KAJ1512253.1 hypothetical protein HMI56_004298 [Coelomomyces lativittatus]KAJ1517670.1 hypothetical protein HMI54_004697 [Coelomomyces lativittatus]
MQPLPAIQIANTTFSPPPPPLSTRSTPMDPISFPSPTLQVPPNTKNFLISPPGSPPSEWESMEESSPNLNTGIETQPNLIFLNHLHEKLARIASSSSSSSSSQNPKDRNQVPVFFIEDTSIVPQAFSQDQLNQKEERK